MTYLIKRSEKQLSNSLSEPTEGQQSATSLDDQKSQILNKLSAKQLNDFDKFDMEPMAEVLYDLLYAMPVPLIPPRYFDYCMYASSSYDDAIKLFGYLPRSHLKLFELIVKFLQIYLKCLNACDSGYNNLMANAIFQIRTTQTNVSQEKNISRDNFKSQTANQFTKTFLENHKQYLTI